MLEAIDIRKYLAEYGSSVNEDGSRILESVSCGGESGPKARTPTAQHSDNIILC